MPFHCIPVLEQIVAQVQEALFEVTRVEILGRGAVVSELLDVLSEAAAEIKKFMLRFRISKQREDTLIGWLKGYGEVEESESADTRIR